MHRFDKMPQRRPSVAWIAAAVVTAVATGPFALAGARANPANRPLGSPSHDQALVYVIHPEGRADLWVFADRQLLGVVDRSAYGFAHVEPGEHLVWVLALGGVPVSAERFEFVAGCTHYLEVNLDSHGPTITQLSRAEGSAAVEAARFYDAPSRGEIAMANKVAERKWTKVQARYAGEPRTEVQKLVAQPPPRDTTGLIRIPRGTTVELRLAENVSSAMNRPGDTVQFRVVDDVIVDGRRVVYAGSVVEARVRRILPAGSDGRPGSIDIDFPGVRAADGSPVPLVGRLIRTGNDRGQAALGSAIAAGGMLGGLISMSIKGSDVLLRIDTVYEVVTPVDVWVDPARASLPAASSGPVELPDRTVPARATRVECNLRTACRALADVAIRIDSEQPVQTVLVRAIEGRPLAAPIPAVAIERNQDGSSTCTFSGWAVVRFVRLKEGTLTPLVQLEGTFADGTPFKSELAPAVVVL